MITKGQRVTILPQWQDPGDSEHQWEAVADEEKGRVDIWALTSKLPLRPIYTVPVSYLQVLE